MEVDQQWLVLGSDRSDRERLATRRAERCDVAQRVRPDGEPRQIRVGNLRGVKHDPRVERDEVLGRGEERVDVDLGDAALLGDEQ